MAALSSACQCPRWKSAASSTFASIAKKFGRGHNQVCQRLFLLDMAPADDDNDVADTTNSLILLHAITGVHTIKTM